MNLSGVFIRRKVMTALIMAAVLFFGLMAFDSLPVSDLPNIDYPTITITASQPGGSPEYMANLVALPLERNFATISGLNTMTSTSSLGNTQIVLNFDLGVDLSSKEVEVQSAITTSLPDLPPLPNNPTYKRTNPSDTPILFLTLSSPFQTLSELYEIGYNILAQPLSMINGVSQVEVYGFPFAIRVQADPMRLHAHKIDLNELSSTLRQSNPNLPSGLIQGRYNEYMLHSQGQVTQASDYENVVIKKVDGAPLYVGNVARCLNALQHRDPYFRYIDSKVNENTVVLAINRLPGSNTLKISNAINKEIPLLKKNIPSSVNLDVFYEKADPIISSVHDVEILLIISLILVVSVIFFYLGNPADTLIPSIVLPMTIIGTFIIMYLAGFNLDTLSLLALTLAIGFIVDDSIVVQENIVRHIEMGKEPYQAALDGSRQISITVFTMTFALSAVFIPFIWMPGILGRIFHEFSLTIIIAIFVSGFIALTLNPLLCSLFLRKRNHGKKSGFSHRMNTQLINKYEKLLRYSLRNPKATLFIGLLCLLLSGLLLYTLPTDFIPGGNLNIIQGLTQCQLGSSRVNTNEHQQKVDEVLRSYPHQNGFITMGSYPTDDQGLFFLKLTPAHQRPLAAKIAHELALSLNKIPGVNVYLKPFPLINLVVGNSSSLGDYQYTLVSSDQKALYHTAGLVVQKMQEMKEIVGVNSDMRSNCPQLNIKIDRDRAGLYGISAAAIESTLQYAYSGGRISTFNRGINLYDLIVEVQPGYNLVKQDLDLLYIKAPTTQKLIPLTSVASWEETVAPSTINHINTFPSVTISFNLAQGIPLGKALKKLESKLNNTLPENVIGTVQGNAAVFIETFKAMKWLVFIAIIVIYLLLGILYESFLHPLTILSALPIAVFGGLLFLAAFGMPLSLFSVVGLIVLIGLVQKNGIMMVDFALEYLKQPNVAVLDATIEACKARFRPILMTTLAAMMAALPVAIGMGDNGDANRPLGIVVVGGLLFSQFITLFVTPVVFMYMQQFQNFVKSKSL